MERQFWLFGYGILRVQDVLDSEFLEIDSHPVGSAYNSLESAAALTFVNPQVYLQTVVLIGKNSLKFSCVNRIAFATGAVTAGFVFFPAPDYSGYLISDIMCRLWA